MAKLYKEMQQVTSLSCERKICILHQEEALLGARMMWYIVCELRGG